MGWLIKGERVTVPSTGKKGSRKTVIKTVMGEVEYGRENIRALKRRWHQALVYILDESMGKQILR